MFLSLGVDEELALPLDILIQNKNMNIISHQTF